MDYANLLQSEMEAVLGEIKPYLKSKNFTRYVQNTESGDDILTICHSFVNEDSGYSIAITPTCLCLEVNTASYVAFDKYAEVFGCVALIINATTDFFTWKRIGLRKVNFCFIDDITRVNKYFSPRYFDCHDLLEGSSVITCSKRALLQFDSHYVNLLSSVEKGQLRDKQVYMVKLDSDAFVEGSLCVPELLMSGSIYMELNESIFKVYVDSLTEEFGQMLAQDGVCWSEEIIGVEGNVYSGI